jgi:3'(2'), 5'-bisphosphate nucleotidase
MDYQRELNAALEAAELAGRAIGVQYARFQQIPDAPAAITTDADRESQEIILQHLHRSFPEDALCAEEATPTLAEAPRTGPRLWIIDPIDGTRGFARKNGEFSVMIGFVDRGRIAVGVVREPALERLTYATKGGGCWRKDGTATAATPCRVSDVSELAKATLTQSRSHKSGPPSPELLALKPGRTISTYSAGIKMAQVARGEADLYLNIYPAFSDWDICAGHILIEEASGRATGLGGEELRYGQPGASQTFGLLGSNGCLHQAALAALRTVRGSKRSEGQGS